jgi:pimeloyl-ACP methyl ester carboxylesterase
VALPECGYEASFEEVVAMTTFVLVHGAFGSSAELALVIPELDALGHRAIAVDLPCTDPAATLDDYARTVVEAMAGIAGPVVVVGHSAGGATISLVPARTHVDRLVYVTAVVPEPGRSIADIAGAAAGFAAGAAGALVYTLHCPEMTAPFLGIWYVLGMLIPTAVGAELGPSLLRW